MPIQLGHITVDPDLSQSWSVARSSGHFALGGWVEDTPSTIPMYGVVSVADVKDIEAIPEGDRIKGSMVFHTNQEMFVTHEAGTTEGTSDIITYNNETYRIAQVAPYGAYGWWRAIAYRMAGN